MATCDQHYQRESNNNNTFIIIVHNNNGYDDNKKYPPQEAFRALHTHTPTHTYTHLHTHTEDEKVSHRSKKNNTTNSPIFCSSKALRINSSTFSCTAIFLVSQCNESFEEEEEKENGKKRCSIRARDQARQPPPSTNKTTRN